MTTKYFQGKWAILYTGNNNYLSGGEDGIAAYSSSITPAGTFILYATTPEGMFDNFQGYVQLQGNMKYLGQGPCSNGYPWWCDINANCSDTADALTMTWLKLSDNWGFSGTNIPDADSVGVVTLEGQAVFAAASTGSAYGVSKTHVVTPGLYEIMKSNSWPNIDLSFVDLSGLSELPFFQGSPFFRGYQFQGSNFEGSVLDGADFDGANLADSNLSNASLAQTKLTGATLSGCNFTACDLTSIVFDSTTVTTASGAAHGSFNSARLPFALINRAWQWLDLRNATVSAVPSALSSQSDPLQAASAKLSGMNQNRFTGMTLAYAALENAILDGLDLSGSDLTSANLSDASLHGSNLSDARLPGANLTGAQLGSLKQLFTLPVDMESDLNAGLGATLAPYFAQNGIKLSMSATLDPKAANRVWSLNDTDNHIVYTIRLETRGDGAPVHRVYAPAPIASLVGAYLPGATLSGINLYGVAANNIQFYGSGARIDGSAILEEAQLNGSNLSGLNLTQAQLLGTNLSDAYLFNAQFNGANLTPSANGVAANLSGSNLQGADFTQAKLYGANLSNAAVAIGTATSGNPNQGGVYLFSLPYTGDANSLKDYETELNAAATRFSLNPNGDQTTLQTYVNALETNDLSALKIPFIEHEPPIVLSATAQIETQEAGSVWQILDQFASYTLWTDTDADGNTELYAAASLTKARAAFQKASLTLRWQASVTIDTPSLQWLLDNDSENPRNRSTGYMSFLLKLNDGVLDVYGTSLRVLRLGADNQNQFDTETCNVTQLVVANMDAATICPNGVTLSGNQQESGKDWDTRWLRASALPKPPSCVPTDYNWCPTSATLRGRASDLGGDGGPANAPI